VFVRDSALSQALLSHRPALGREAKLIEHHGSPSAVAVLRLITNSNLVDFITGRSAGFSPFRMRMLAIARSDVGSVAQQRSCPRATA
jgi:hypothetical protein